MNASKGIVQKLPVYQWLIVLPQLISRVCHPHAATATTVRDILKRLVIRYPQQASCAILSLVFPMPLIRCMSFANFI